MKAVNDGNAQLPDFQREWVWDDNRIKALISSVTNNYPVGAAMFLEFGNQSIRFKYRTITGSPSDGKGVIPNELILDGQQRLTSLFNALYSDKPVATKTDKGKNILRYYYMNIEKSLDSNSDIDDIIVSVPDSKVVTSNFGRDIELDLSTQEKEFENKYFPLNIILNFPKILKWQNELYTFYNQDANIVKLFSEFQTKVVLPTLQYKMPVIVLGKETPKEAVCQVFENVNTGGVSLTVFELVTAIFAMDDFELRKDWDIRKTNYFSGDILSEITATDFLTAITLLASYKKGNTVSCKKKDVLNLKLEDYKKYADSLCEGFVEAEKLLQEERVFVSRDLPYTTQLIPLAAICSALSIGNAIRTTTVRDKIKQWYWCGVFGELYGSANETRYVNDLVGVCQWIANPVQLPRTVQDSYFNPQRLVSMQTRQSAAYKGIMALILKNNSKDFISGRNMDFTAYKSEYIDIHHIFPKDYCIKNQLNLRNGKENYLWNSVVNKTPISYSTNREIGGVAPSKYLKTIETAGKVSADDLNTYLESHWIDADCIRNDDFFNFIIRRASMLLDAVERATGKKISGRDSQDVIETFGGILKSE
jgi:hypothetical protein